MAKILAPLVNMIKEGCENYSALLILLIFFFKMHKKSNPSLDNKNLKGGKYHYEINVFLRYTDKLLAPLEILWVNISEVYSYHNFEHSRVIYEYEIISHGVLFTEI